MPRRRKTNLSKTKRKITKAKNTVEEEKKPAKIDPSEPTQIIFYNGEPILVPISKIPKGKSGWKKFTKYLKNIAVAGITLGALGYGAYKSKKGYDKYLKGPVDFGAKIIKSGWNLFAGTGNTVKKVWESGDTFGEKISNAGGMLKNKVGEMADSIIDKFTMKKNWEKALKELENNPYVVFHNENRIYFILDVFRKCFLYDNISKDVMRDSNSMPMTYDINLAEKIYDSQGRLVYDKKNAGYKLYFYIQ